VTTQTLRDWDKAGKIKTVRSQGNQRRVPLSEVEAMTQQAEREVVLVYARCSTQKQVENLERQVGRLLEYANNKYQSVELFKDIGSGLNENRRQFKKLLSRIPDPDVSAVLVEYKDRLSRYGFDTFKSYCESLGVHVEVMEESDSKEFEQEFAEDIVALIASYSARLYGRRGGKARKCKEATK
jgi:putative resolvase